MKVVQQLICFTFSICKLNLQLIFQMAWIWSQKDLVSSSTGLSVFQLLDFILYFSRWIKCNYVENYKINIALCELVELLEFKVTG